MKKRLRIPPVDWIMVAALSLALPVLAMTSLPEGRLPGTHDAWLHLLRLINAAANLNDGMVMPRWGSHLHFGFGYPLGNFYAPGWHIAGGALVVLGLPAVTTLLIFQAIGLLLYPLGGYVFARSFTDRTGAVLGAAVCLLAPLRFYEVFIQGNISQLIAMGLIAWVLWGFARCAQSPSLGNGVLAGGILAALIMTHHPTSTFAVPLAGAYGTAAALIQDTSRRRRLTVVVGAFILGLMLSATYWLPALTEVRYVNVQAAADEFQVQDNFVPLRDLLRPIQAPDRGSLNMPFTFSIGLGSWVLGLVGGLIALSPRVKLSRWQKFHALGGLLLAVVCLYLMTYHSWWVWQAVPKASLVLFPWRLLSVLTVALIPPAVMVLTVMPDRVRPWIVILLIAALFGSMLPLLFPLYDNESDLGTVTPATSLQYEYTSGNLGGVSNNEYLPQWADHRPDFDICPDCYRDWDWHLFVNGRTLPATAQVNTIEADHRAGGGFAVTSPEAFQLELRQMYFPGWRVTVDGKRVPVVATEPYGLIAFDVPAGEHTIQVWYAGTRTQHSANGISLAALGLCGLLLVLHRRRRSVPVVSVVRRAGDIKIAGAAVGIMLAAALILRTVIAPHTDWFREQGDPAAPPGMETKLGAIFTDEQGTPALELIGYTLSTTSAGYDDWLFVTLYWQALQPLDHDWQVRLAFCDPADLSEWSFSNHSSPGGYPPMLWPTDRYVIDRHILRLDDTIPPYVGNLLVRVYAAEGAELRVNESPRLTLDQVRIDEPGTYTLPDQAQRVDVIFGEWLHWRGYELIPQDEGYQLRLYWHVRQTPPVDYALMLHWQDGNADQPLIPSYPTSSWQVGQYLITSVDLTLPSNTDSLLIGVYDYPTVQRAPVDIRVGDLAVQDNAVVLPIP